MSFDKGACYFDTGGGAMETVMDPILLGYFIKMGRFDRKRQTFREDSVLHGNTWAVIYKGPFPDRTPDLSRTLTNAISRPGSTEDL
jgi:hypothetical protein